MQSRERMVLVLAGVAVVALTAGALPSQLQPTFLAAVVIGLVAAVVRRRGI